MLSAEEIHDDRARDDVLRKNETKDDNVTYLYDW